MASAASAASAQAQTTPVLKLDPGVAGEGTTALLGVDGAALSSSGRSPTSIVFALPRGMRLDTRARERLCSRAQAARALCPKASRIGFGRIAVGVAGYLAPGGETEVAWSIDAYLGPPARSADAASIVLRSALLGPDRVSQLLTPVLESGIPSVSMTTGRVVRQGQGKYGLEIRFAELPGGLRVRAPATATPTRFELAIGAVRRTRQDFVHRVRVRTLNGHRTQRIPDHRLVGYDLLRNPESCRGSWAYELRVGFPGGVQRTSDRFACLPGR